MADSSIDKSIGFVLMGLLVAGFIFLTILGLSSVQSDATDVADGPPEVQTPDVEIGAE